MLNGLMQGKGLWRQTGRINYGYFRLTSRFQAQRAVRISLRILSCHCWPLPESASHLCFTKLPGRPIHSLPTLSLRVMGVQGHARVSHLVKSQSHCRRPSCLTDKDSAVTHHTPVVPRLSHQGPCALTPECQILDCTF